MKDVIGRALLDVQFGDVPIGARPLSGFGSAAVMEIIEDHDRSTYRAVYTAKLGSVVYVLHAFQKKSKRGIATPKHDIGLIRERFQTAREHYESHLER